MDHQGDAGPLARFDHPVRIFQRGCDGLLAKDAFRAGCNSIDGHLGVDVVGGCHAEDVDPLIREHLTVVGVGLDVGQRFTEIAAEALEQVGHQITDRYKLGLGKIGIVSSMRGGYDLSQNRIRRRLSRGSSNPTHPNYRRLIGFHRRLPITNLLGVNSPCWLPKFCTASSGRRPPATVRDLRSTRLFSPRHRQKRS